MNLKLDSVVIFALVIPFIMTYRISPLDTPYWLFGLIFLGLASYISLDVFFKFGSNLKNRLKNILLFLLIILTIGSVFYSEITVRHQTSPIYNVHDIVVQQESAIRFLLHGKNPYAATYFGTPLEKWHYSDRELNPALYHFVMEPFYLLFAIPFYFLSVHTIGFFDGRIPLLFLFFSVLLMAGKVVKDEEKKRLFITLLAFNPATLGYMLEGRDDMFMFAFLFAGLLFLSKGKNYLGGIAIGFAFAIKQSAWPIFPFYLAYLYFKNRNVKKTLLEIFPFAVTFLIIIFPFFLWNSKAFLDSTIFYLSGNAQHSYPIAGYGFGKLLNQLGFIKDVNSYYPFWIWQAIFGIPLLVFLIRYLKRNTNIKTVIFIYGIFLLVFWYFSRYLNNSHLGYLSTVFITAYFWPQEKLE